MNPLRGTVFERYGMAQKSLPLLLIAVLLGASARAQSSVSDPDVRKGIRLVDDGDYDGAIVTLDAATRRLAADPSHAPDLPQAYLYLGVAFVGKGHEAAAKAKFREALKQARDLSLSSDKFPPKVIDLFEVAREEMGREVPSAPPSPEPSPMPSVAKKSGGSKTWLILGGVAAVGGGVALAAKGSGGNATTSSTLTTSTFPNEVVVFGGGREFSITVQGTGELKARCDWLPDGVVLAMYIVNLANPTNVLANAGQSGAKEVSLSIPVTPGTFRIAVTNSTGMGAHVDTTFTLTVLHP
jgi:hypothetical protein